MRSLRHGQTAALVLGALASLRCGGGSPTITCQTQLCAGGASKSDPACGAAQVAAYCAGDSGAGGGGGATACTVTFSGAFSTTYSPCAVTITAVPAGNVWTVGTAGNALPGTPYTWPGMSFALPGSPATGTFDQSQATGASNLVEDTSVTDPPEWIAGAGSGMSYGAATLTITALGPATAVSGTTLYQSPHGTWTGTLVDQNPNTHQPDLMETITF